MAGSTITINQDWPSSEAPEGYRISMELKGAPSTEIYEFADWLEDHNWLDQAAGIREYDPFGLCGHPQSPSNPLDRLSKIQMPEGIKISYRYPNMKFMYEPETNDYVCTMEVLGATYKDLQELADWLDTRDWREEATSIREHYFPA